MIGWIQLSRKAVARAEQALNDQRLGVRDEIGFLALHQSFADRFFPGTSVLHTRLRYALFVPWLLERSAGNSRRFHDESLKLTRQLAASGEQGVIGARNLQREPAQTAAMIYWSALARWGILHPRPDQATPTRKQVLQRIAVESRESPANTIDGELSWAPDHWPFVGLPPPPDALLRAGQAIDFKLTHHERNFLRRQLMAVCRDDGEQSLFGRLVEQAVSVRNFDNCWHKSIRRAADSEDRGYLTLAAQVASLAGIGRAVYSALVEQAKNRDVNERIKTYRDHLEKMCATHGEHALALDTDALHSAFPELHSSLMKVLIGTQSWLGAKRKDITVLAEVFGVAESYRKGTRARLGHTLAAQNRRAEWNTLQMPQPLGEPLHYRWFRVRTLLEDLGPA